MCFKSVISAGMVSLFSICPASAGFEEWTAATEKDPFSGGNKVTSDYMTSLRSGVFMLCDTAEPGLLIRAIPGFAYSDGMSALSIELEFAVDGNSILKSKGNVVAVGDNVAAAQTFLTGYDASRFIAAFAGASQQVAIKDGLSDSPFLLSARGSTKAGLALQACNGK